MYTSIMNNFDVLHIIGNNFHNFDENKEYTGDGFFTDKFLENSILT